MRANYSKLVRDRIPEYIRQHGTGCGWEIMTEEAFKHALCDKLVEEAQEAREASSERLVAELADLYEVIDALLHVYNISPEQVKMEQAKKRAERGGFEQRIRLLWTE